MDGLQHLGPSRGWRVRSTWAPPGEPHPCNPGAARRLRTRGHKGEDLGSRAVLDRHAQVQYPRDIAVLRRDLAERDSLWVSQAHPSSP